MESDAFKFRATKLISGGECAGFAGNIPSNPSQRLQIGLHRGLAGLCRPAIPAPLAPVAAATVVSSHPSIHRPRFHHHERRLAATRTTGISASWAKIRVHTSQCQASRRRTEGAGSEGVPADRTQGKISDDAHGRRRRCTNRLGLHPPPPAIHLSFSPLPNSSPHRICRKKSGPWSIYISTNQDHRS